MTRRLGDTGTYDWVDHLDIVGTEYKTDALLWRVAPGVPRHSREHPTPYDCPCGYARSVYLFSNQASELSGC